MYLKFILTKRACSANFFGKNVICFWHSFDCITIQWACLVSHLCKQIRFHFCCGTIIAQCKQKKSYTIKMTTVYLLLREYVNRSLFTQVYTCTCFLIEAFLCLGNHYALERIQHFNSKVLGWCLVCYRHHMILDILKHSSRLLLWEEN